MDNKEELEKIKEQISNINNTLIRVNSNIDGEKMNNTFWRILMALGGTMMISFVLGIGVKEASKRKEIDKILLYNGDNAIIFDKEDDSIENMQFDNCSVIYIDEDKGISANDIAVSLVGEDGTVYYYNSETKEKTLINQK